MGSCAQGEQGSVGKCKPARKAQWERVQNGEITGVLHRLIVKTILSSHTRTFKWGSVNNPKVGEQTFSQRTPTQHKEGPILTREWGPLVVDLESTCCVDRARRLPNFQN